MPKARAPLKKGGGAEGPLPRGGARKGAARAPPALPEGVTVGSFCSGIGAPEQALHDLGVEIDSKFAADILPQCRAIFKANFPTQQMFDDLFAIPRGQLPTVDFFSSGFPCQSHSSLGDMAGLDDPRGQVWFGVRDYIRTRLPTCFLLENVAGLDFRHDGEPSALDTIMKQLRRIGKYEVRSAKLTPIDYGWPQARKRVYIVGILRDHLHRDLDTVFPPPKIMTFSTRAEGKLTTKLKSFIERKPSPVHLQYDKKILSDERKNRTHLTPHRKKILNIFVQQARRAWGVDLRTVPQIANITCSVERAKKGWPANLGPRKIRGVAPCVTRGEAVNLWWTHLGRYVTPKEALRVQGFPASFDTAKESDLKVYECAGNSMCVPVVAKILGNVLPHVDFGRKSATVKKRSLKKIAKKTGSKRKGSMSRGVQKKRKTAAVKK